jgi:hypothetical protein
MSVSKLSAICKPIYVTQCNCFSKHNFTYLYAKLMCRVLAWKSRMKSWTLLALVKSGGAD